MSIPRRYTENDLPQMEDGDNGFVGVNMRSPPQQIEPGYVAEAVNTRFRYGKAEPRKGMQALNWAQLLGANFPLQFPIQWNVPVSIGEPVGAGKFQDPNGVEWLLFAAKRDNAVKVYAITPNNRVLTVPSTVAITADTDTDYFFTQCFNKVILFRGENYEPLELSDVTIGFTSISQTALSTDSGTATESIPNGPNGLFFRNRLLVPNVESGSQKVDLLSLSDYLNYTKYLPGFGDWRVNQGDADEIVRAVEYNDQTIVVFKDSSIYQINVPTSSMDSAVLTKITGEYGLIGPRTVVNVGRDLWFLSQWGVTSIGQTAENKLQGRSVPISEAMQPIIDRINWPVAKRTAVAEYYRDRVYFSVPIDGSAKNNCVLVYDFLNKAWSGYDYWAGAAKVAYFLKADFLAGESLFYVDYDGVVGLYEFSEQDTQLTEPDTYYAQILLNAQPATNDTIQVNGGAVITADRGISGNTLTDWSVDSLVNAISNLYDGYNAYSWSHNTDSVRQITNGVEFCDADNPIDIRYSPYSSVEAVKIYSDAKKTVSKLQIDHYIVTRGYHFDRGDRRRSINAQVFIGTLDSRYKLTMIQDGVSEEKLMIDESTGSVRSALEYTLWNKSPWDPTNTNNDFSSPYREDYLVNVSDTSTGTYALKLFDNNADVKLNNYQKTTKRLNVERRGAFFQLKLQGVQGRTQLEAVSMNAVRGRNNNGSLNG